MNDAAEAYCPSLRPELDGEHAVATLLVVAARDNKPLAARLFSDRLAIANPLHGVGVSVNGHQIWQVRVRVVPTPNNKPLSFKQCVYHSRRSLGAA